MLIRPAGPVFRKQNFLSLKSGASSTAGGVALTPNATANTKGAYSQLIASTANRTVWMVLILQASVGGSPTSQAWLVDIAAGASGSEVVIVPNIAINVVGGFGSTAVSLVFPIKIAAGTRLSARCQSDSSSTPTGVSCLVQIFDGDITQIQGGNGIDNLSAKTATSLGTAITPGSSGSKGSYAQMIAATSRDYVGFFGVIDKQDHAEANFDYLSTDIAVGGSGSEAVVFPNFLTFNAGAALPCSIPFTPIRILAGTRIAARMAQTSAGTVTTKGLSLYGVY